MLGLIEADARRRVPRQYEDAWTLLKGRSTKAEATVQAQTQKAWARYDEFTDEEGM